MAKTTCTYGAILGISALLLAGCAAFGSANTEQSSGTATTATATQVRLTGETNGQIALAAYSEPEPEEWHEFIKPVRQYFYYRTQAVLHDDMNLLWNVYPLLRTGGDPAKGINNEQAESETLNNLSKHIDANYMEEEHERIKVYRISDNEASVLVHGIVTYTRDDFDLSGSELLIKLHMAKEGADWTVVQSDEYTVPEYKQYLKDKL